MADNSAKSDTKEDTSGLSWIYNLSKAQVIETLKNEYNIEADESEKLDKLRKVLKREIQEAHKFDQRPEIKEKEELEENAKTELQKVPKADQAPEKSQQEKQTRVSTKIETPKKKKMEYKAGVDFDIHKNDWEQFTDRMELYFIANDITDDTKKRAILLTKVDAKTYETICKICAPKKPVEVELKALIKKITDYLKPKVNVTVLRAQFRRRVQSKNESIAQYTATLQELAKKCEFKDVDDAIKDQFISGILEEEAKLALFKEEKLTLDGAIKIASAVEEAKAAIQNINIADEKRYSKEETMEEVNMVNRRGAKFTTPNKGKSHQNKNKPQSQGTKCMTCGLKGHKRENCYHRNKICSGCHKKGHLQRICRNNENTEKRRSVKNIEQDTEKEDDSDVDDFVERCSGLFNVEIEENIMTIERVEPQFLKVQIEDQVIEMEMDTGAGISLISNSDYQKWFNREKMVSADLSIKYYTGEKRKLIGMLKNVNLEYENIKSKGNLYIIENKKGNVPIIGRDWLSKLGLWPLELKQQKINRIEENETYNEKIMGNLMQKYKELFTDGMGTYTKDKFKLKIKENTEPIYKKPRTVPFALREKISQELDRLVKEKVYEPVEASEWATPIVPIIKPDGKLRICADYKVTINQHILIDKHDIPSVNEILAQMHNGVFYSRVDLKEAYAQVEIEEESKKYFTINTHVGLFQPNKLQYGVASAPGFFQKNMVQLLKHMKNVYVLLDDIYVKSQTIPEMVEYLKEIFQILKNAGLKIKKEKCILAKKKMEIFGLELDKDGIRPLKSRIEALSRIPEPTNVKELQAFLGTVNYYDRFIENRAAKFRPLYDCLVKDKFSWDAKCSEAFERAKKELMSRKVLANYDPNKKLILTTDASNDGISAVLAHETPEGEKPIAYAAKALSKSEKSYAIIDKEAKAIIYGITKFYDYLYGHEFTIKTDHEPLVRIFGPKMGIPIMAARRLQRYAHFLSAFNFQIKYIKSKDNCADGLSRLLAREKTKLAEKEEYSYLNYINESKFLCLDWKIVSQESRKDKISAQVIRYLKEGWPEKGKIKNELHPYWLKRNELTMEQDCVMWGYRVIIPEKLQGQILKELHLTHMGIVRMKAIARSFFWWPGIDKNIEEEAQGCRECVQERDSPNAAKLNPWQWPNEPWQRLHTDLIGPLDGKFFLLIIDAHSKWPEIFQIKSINSETLIKYFKQVFARFGLPKQVVSDNGRQYVSEEFKLFLKKRDIKHICSPVKHPQTNGAAENMVKTFKKKFESLQRQGINVENSLQMFLFDYRASKHNTTGESPAKLLLNRELRTRFDLLRPNISDTIEKALESQKINKRGGREIDFKKGDCVWAKNFSRNKDRWEEAVISKILGPVTYMVTWKDGGSDKRHLDQIMRREKKLVPENDGTMAPRRSLRLQEKQTK